MCWLGMYKGGSFTFTFAINSNYPHDPPKIKCTQKIYHPNIDLEGNICLNILREDWRPVLNINSVVVGLQVCSLFSSCEKWKDRLLTGISCSISSSNLTRTTHLTRKRQRISDFTGITSFGMLRTLCKVVLSRMCSLIGY